METAASFEKPGKFFKRRLEKPAGFPTVPTGPAAVNQQTTKPDRSLATKTGHFHLLPTHLVLSYARATHFVAKTS
jgi:hypothetical protein